VIEVPMQLGTLCRVGMRCGGTFVLTMTVMLGHFASDFLAAEANPHHVW
jgi:hypothetical protein